MLKIKHVRDFDGHPIATIAKDGDKVGISICGPKDNFNKRIGRNIAIERMNGGYKLKFPRRDIAGDDYYFHIGELIMEGLCKLEEGVMS